MRLRPALQLVGLTLAAANAGEARAQAPSVGVTGVVYDSLMHQPLAGAVVQIALVDSAVAPRVFSAVSDEMGRYRIGGLPHGRFAIGFQHDALNALGLESPLRAFQVAIDTTLTIDLAVPSGPMVRLERCDTLAKGGTDGMLAGYAFDARRNIPLAGAIVEIRWSEVSLEKGAFTTVPRTLNVPVGDDGTYLACGVGTDEAVSVRVSLPGFWTLADEVNIPAGSAMRQDFRLAADAGARGLATLNGRVVRDDGVPLASGRARIAALGIEVPINTGDFAMTELPAGTWTVHAVAIGFDPRSKAVDVPERGVVSTTIIMGVRTQMLDTMTVIARRNQNSKLSDDIIERRRVTAGTAFLPGNSWLETGTYPADVVRAARGFNYKGPTAVEARGCILDSMQIGQRGKAKQIVVYIDGLRAPLGLEQVRTSVQMADVLAVETYPDVTSAPFLWRTNDACAVIAFWTKRSY